MSSSREHRLAYRTVAQINRQRIAAGAAPITSAANPTGTMTPRAVQENAETQNAYADTKGIRGVNPNADFIEANVRENISPDDWAAMTPEQQANHNKGMELADASNFNGTPGSTAGTAPGAGAMGKPGALGHNPGGAPLKSSPNRTNPTTSGPTPTESQLRANGVLDPLQLSQARNLDMQNEAERQKILSEQQKRKQIGRDADVQSKGMTPETQPDADPLLSGLMQYAQENPEFAATFLPQLAQLQNMRSGVNAQADSAQAELDSSDRNQDGVTDGVASSVADSKAMVATEKQETDRILEENKKIQLDSAEIAKEMAQIEKDRFELNQIRRENELREQNLESELKNRRISAKLGISADTNGLQWMQKAIRQGNEALRNLEADGDLIRQGYALQIGRQYQNDVRSVINGYDDKRHAVDVQYRKDLAEWDKVVSADAEERRKDRQAIEEKRQDRLFQADLKAIDSLQQASNMMYNMKKDARAESRQKQMDAREGLKWVLDTYGSEADPKLVDHFTKDIGMEGDWFRAQTLAEIKQATGEAVKPLEVLNFQTGLRKEFKDAEAYKANTKIERNYDTITNAIRDSNAIMEKYNAGDKNLKDSLLGSDTTMLYSFIKMLDDTSAVREGELDLVMAGQSAASWARGQYARLTTTGGTPLSIDERNSILAQVESMNQFVTGKYQEHVSDTEAVILDANDRLGLNIDPKAILGADYYPGGADQAEDDINEASGDEPSEESHDGHSHMDYTSWQSSVGTGQEIKGSPFHSGVDKFAVDIDGRIGDPIKAPIGGTVKSVVTGRKRGEENYGNTIVWVDDNGYEHLIGHASDVYVKQGQRITPGMKIAAVGNTGLVKAGPNGDGSHVHYRITKDGKPVNPKTYAYGKQQTVAQKTSGQSSGAKSTYSEGPRTFGSQSAISGVRSTIPSMIRNSKPS